MCVSCVGKPTQVHICTHKKIILGLYFLLQHQMPKEKEYYVVFESRKDCYLVNL